jgi:hypothetical protein
MRLVAFGVDFGNLRPATENAPDMNNLCRSWNSEIRARGVRACVAHWYHKTGNLVIEADDLDISGVTRLVELVSGDRKFAVFAYESFREWTEKLELGAKSPPPVTPGRRWTAGTVMDTNPLGGLPPLIVGKDPVCFGDLAGLRLRLAWRNDLLLPGGTVLDPKRREGGWGAVAVQMDRHTRGKWTARALSRAVGLLNDFETKGPRCQG